MAIETIKQQFGEPDSYDEWWNDEGSTRFASATEATSYQHVPNTKYEYHVERLGYGVFGAHSQKTGHVTRNRLTLSSVNGKLKEWQKSTPLEQE